MLTHRPLRAVAAAFLLSAILVAACSSDPVVDPSSVTSPGASPSVAPSLMPGTSSTPGPAPPGTPSSSVQPSFGLPIDQALFSDDFGDAASPLWGTGTHASGSVGYAAGALRIELAADLNSLWSWRSFQPRQTLELVRAEGTVSASGAGAAGWMCGLGDDRFVGGLIHSSGDWVVVDIVESRSSALDRGPLPDGIDAALPHRLAVECAGSDAGTMRVRLLVDGQEAVSLERATGIRAFDRVGAYAFADQAGYAAVFDDAAVSGGDAGDEGIPGSPSPSPGP